MRLSPVTPSATGAADRNIARMAAANGGVFAFVDPVSGQERWRFDPHIDRARRGQRPQ